MHRSVDRIIIHWSNGVSETFTGPLVSAQEIKTFVPQDVGLDIPIEYVTVTGIRKGRNG